MPDARSASNVVTSENRAEFMAARVKPAAPAKVVEKPDDAAVKVVQDAKPANGADGEPKHKSSVDERMSEMSAKRREAEQRARDAEERATKAEKELQDSRKPKDGKPKPEDFTDPVKFAESLADWRVEEKLKERAEADRKTADEKKQAELTAAWNKRYKAAQKQIEDFDEVIMAEPLSLQPPVVTAMFESEVGPQLHYFFSKNREEADKINEMSAASAVRYLGRIEARIEAENAAREKKDDKKGNLEVVASKPVRRAVEAPEPIVPIAGSTSANVSGVIDADGKVVGTYSQYKEARRAGKIK